MNRRRQQQVPRRRTHIRVNRLLSARGWDDLARGIITRVKSRAPSRVRRTLVIWVHPLELRRRVEPALGDAPDGNDRVLLAQNRPSGGPGTHRTMERVHAPGMGDRERTQQPGRDKRRARARLARLRPLLRLTEQGSKRRPRRAHVGDRVLGISIDEIEPCENEVMVAIDERMIGRRGIFSGLHQFDVAPARVRPARREVPEQRVDCKEPGRTNADGRSTTATRPRGRTLPRGAAYGRCSGRRRASARPLGRVGLSSAPGRDARRVGAGG